MILLDQQDQGKALDRKKTRKKYARNDKRKASQAILAKKFYLLKNQNFTPTRKRRYLVNYCDLEAHILAPKSGLKKI